MAAEANKSALTLADSGGALATSNNNNAAALQTQLQQQKVLDTPRTREACRRLGLMLEDLQFRPFESFANPGDPKEKVSLRFDHNEKRRKERLAQVLAERAKVIAQNAKKGEAPGVQSGQFLCMLESLFEKEAKRLELDLKGQLRQHSALVKDNEEQLRKEEQMQAKARERDLRTKASKDRFGEMGTKAKQRLEEKQSANAAQVARLDEEFREKQMAHARELLAEEERMGRFMAEKEALSSDKSAAFRDADASVAFASAMGVNHSMDDAQVQRVSRALGATAEAIEGINGKFDMIDAHWQQMQEFNEKINSKVEGTLVSFRRLDETLSERADLALNAVMATTEGLTHVLEETLHTLQKFDMHREMDRLPKVIMPLAIPLIILLIELAVACAYLGILLSSVPNIQARYANYLLANAGSVLLGLTLSLLWLGMYRAFLAYKTRRKILAETLLGQCSSSVSASASAQPQAAANEEDFPQGEVPDLRVCPPGNSQSELEGYWEPLPSVPRCSSAPSLLSQQPQQQPQQQPSSQANPLGGGGAAQSAAEQLELAGSPAVAETLPGLGTGHREAVGHGQQAALAGLGAAAGGSSRSGSGPSSAGAGVGSLETETETEPDMGAAGTGTGMGTGRSKSGPQAEAGRSRSSRSSRSSCGRASSSASAGSTGPATDEAQRVHRGAGQGNSFGVSWQSPTTLSVAWRKPVGQAAGPVGKDEEPLGGNESAAGSGAAPG